MTLRELVTKWTFDIKDKPLEGMEQKIEGIKKRIDLLIGAEILEKLFSLGERFAKIGEEIKLASDAAGISAESFQKLAYAARLNNVEQDEMQQGLRVLARRLYDARKGGAEAQTAFKNVGFTPEQVRGFRNTQEAVLAMSDRFHAIQDPIKKAALAQELMGRGGTRLVGFLSKGSKAINAYGKEAERLGIVLSSGQVEALDELENTLQKLWAVFKSFAGVVAATVAPAIKLAVELFIKFLAANRDLIQLNMKGYLLQIAYGFGFVFGIVEGLIIQFQKLAKFFGFEGRIGEFLGKLTLLVTGFFALQKGISLVVTVFTALRAIMATSALFLSPWLLGITALVFGIQALWTVLNGGNFWDSWLGQMFSAIYQFSAKLADLTGITSLVGKASGFASSLFNGGGPPSGALSAQSNSSNLSISAPMTFNVPEGTSPGDVGKSVSEGVTKHFERVMRQTNRSTAPTVAY